MSLNLQPGQILPNSIYQPTQPSHFPLEFGQGTHPPSQDSRVPRKPVEYPAADYDTANAGSPLRRYQTLPAPSMARGTPRQFYQEPPPVTSEVLPNQHPHPADSNFHQRNLPQPPPIDSVPSRSSGRRRMSQISRQPSASPYAPPPSHSHPSQSTGVDHPVTHHSPYADMSHNSVTPSQISPAASVGPSEAPPYPGLDQHFSRSLYLTNPDDAHRASGHRPHGSPLPTAPEIVYPPSERRSERPRRSHHSSLYSGQPSLAVPRPTDSEGRRRRESRGSPPTKGRTSEQDSSRRYELTVANPSSNQCPIRCNSPIYVFVVSHVVEPYAAARPKAPCHANATRQRHRERPSDGTPCRDDLTWKWWTAYTRTSTTQAQLTS